MEFQTWAGPQPGVRQEAENRTTVSTTAGQGHGHGNGQQPGVNRCQYLMKPLVPSGPGSDETGSPPASDSQELYSRFLFPVHFRLYFSTFHCSLFFLSFCLCSPFAFIFVHKLLQGVQFAKVGILLSIWWLQSHTQSFHHHGDPQFVGWLVA